MIHSTPFVKFIDTTILTVCLAFNAFILDAEVQSIAIAVGGSLCGAIILAYFRRDPRKGEQVLKVLCSAIGGLVMGTVAQEYLHIESPAYRLGLFFASSMLSLFVLRTLLTMTEKNGADLIRSLLQRIFNLQLKEERTRQRMKAVEGQVSDTCEVLEKHIAKVAPQQKALKIRVEKLEENEVDKEEGEKNENDSI